MVVEAPVLAESLVCQPMINQRIRPPLPVAGWNEAWTVCEGLIYESLDKMKKFEPKYRLKRARRSVSVHTGIGAEVMDLGLKKEKQNAGAVLLHPS